MGELLDKAVNAIIRPPRREYNVEDLPLFLDCGDSKTYIRHPLNFSNVRDQKIVGSIYLENTHDIMDGGPCVIYMHGNASSQLEGQFLVPNLCPHGIAVYCFDFAGCGMSDGEFISLGHYETQDVEFLMDFLHSTFNLGPFILWGRSMGAATAVMARHKLLSGIIVDSTFTSIKNVCGAIAHSQKLPKAVIPAVIWFLKHNVTKKANFDITKVSPLYMAQQPGTVPMVMGHATDDEFIPVQQGRDVYTAYAHPDKEFKHLDRGHNGRRPPEWIKLCCEFIFRIFKLSVPDFQPSSFYGFNSQEDHKHFASYKDMIKSKNKNVKSSDESSDCASEDN